MIARKTRTKSSSLIQSGLKHPDSLLASNMIDRRYLSRSNKMSKSRKSCRNMKRRKRKRTESVDFPPFIAPFPNRATATILSSEIEAALPLHLLLERSNQVFEQNSVISRGLCRPCNIFGESSRCFSSFGQDSGLGVLPENSLTSTSSPKKIPIHTYGMNSSVRSRTVTANQVAANMNRVLDFSLAKGVDLLPVIALQVCVPKYYIETFLDGDAQNFFSERVNKKTEKALRAWMKEHGRWYFSAV